MSPVDEVDPSQHGLSDDPTVSNSLPARYFTDPAIFELERERIFYRSWLFVGHVTDIPATGDYFTTSVIDQSIIVIRSSDGEIGAFYNVCQHRGHELLDGTGHVARITCPYHAWSYRLDGTLAGVRNADHVAGFSMADFPLTPVGVETLAGLIFVNLDAEAETLAESAAGLEAEIIDFVPNAEALVHAHQTRDVMRCNWKIAVENWSECYHCANVHKKLAKEFIDFATFRIELNPLYQRQRMFLRESVIDAATVGDEAVGTGEQASWTLLPNLGIQIVHGGYLMTSRWRPIDADRCEFIEDWYLPSAEPTDRQRELFAFRSDYTQPEDVEVCEGVQRGLHSRGYQRGRLMVDAAFTELSEHGTHHIQHWVAQRLMQQGLFE